MIFSLIKNKMNSVENIIFSKINDIYSHGKYGDIEVIILNKNGFINVSKLTILLNPKKKIGNWNTLKESKDTINYVCTETGLRKDDIIVEINDGSKYCGTFAHHLLVLGISIWASKKFYIKIARILNEYINNENLKEKELLLQKKDNKIIKKKGKISELKQLIMEMNNKTNTKIDNSNKKIDETLKNNKKIIKKLDETKEDNKIITKKLDETKENNKIITKKLDETNKKLDKTSEKLNKTNQKLDNVLDVTTEISKRTVTYTENSNDHEYVSLINLNNSDLQIRVVRGQKNYVKYKVNEHKKQHIGAYVLFEFQDPNSVMVWKRTRQNYLKQNI